MVAYVYHIFILCSSLYIHVCVYMYIYRGRERKRENLALSPPDVGRHGQPRTEITPLPPPMMFACEISLGGHFHGETK